jgi:hypothetical protein
LEAEQDLVEQQYETPRLRAIESARDSWGDEELLVKTISLNENPRIRHDRQCRNLFGSDSLSWQKCYVSIINLALKLILFCSDDYSLDFMSWFA